MQQFNRGPETSFGEMRKSRDIMSDFAQRGLTVFREAVYQGDALFRMFVDLSSKIEMVCAKADMEIARL